MSIERFAPAAAMNPPPGGRWWLLFTLATLLVLLAYRGSLDHPFTRDDTAHFADRARWERPPDDWGAHFREEFWAKGGRSGLYRPLTALTIQAQLRAGDGLPPADVVPAPPAPRALRIGNLLLLAAAAASAGWLAARLGATRLCALLTTALVAWHPLLSEDALEIVSRSETQAALGVLLAAGVLVRDPAMSWSRAALAGLCFLFALGSKEGAFAAFPALLLLGRLALRPVMALTAALLVALVGRVEVFGDLVGFDPAQTAFVDNPLIAAPLATRLWTGLSVLGRQLLQLAWPERLSVDWSYAAITPLEPFGDAHAWLGAAAVVAALLALAVAWRRGAHGTLFGLLLALCSWFLVSNIARPVGTVMGERLFTLPAIGLLIAGAVALARASRFARAAGLFLLLPALLAFGWRTDRRVADWRDGLTLYSAAERVVPGSARVQATLAHLQFLRGRPELAADHATKAIELLPDYGKPHATLANCLAAQRRLGASLVHLWLAARATGADAELVLQLEAARAKVLQDERARLDFLRHGRGQVAAQPGSALHQALGEELARVERGGR